MLLATAYILLAGSYLEWCMILRSRYEVRSGSGSRLCASARILQVSCKCLLLLTFEQLCGLPPRLWIRQHNA